MMRRALRLAVLLAPAVLLPVAAQAATHDRDDALAATAQRWSNRLLDETERAVTLAGVLVARNPNAVSGGLLGCAAGTAAGATTALGLAAATGGAALAGAPEAMALGCGLGAAAGASLGHSLDRRMDGP